MLQEYLPSQSSYFTLEEEIKNKNKQKNLSLIWGAKRVGDKTSWHWVPRYPVHPGPGSENEIVEHGYIRTSEG